jgi:hypothetical protein
VSAAVLRIDRKWQRAIVRNVGWVDIGWVRGFCKGACTRGWIGMFRVTRPKWWRLRWDVELAGGKQCFDDAGYDHVTGCKVAIEDGLGRR